MALSTNHEGEYVSANNSDGVVLTSTDRLDELLGLGFAFETVTAQAAFVEAIVLMYLSTARSRLPNQEREALEKRIRSNSLTVGAMATFIEENALLDAAAVADLGAYVQARNAIAHSMIASSTAVNLEETYRLGEKLIAELKSDHTGYSASIFIPHPKK